MYRFTSTSRILPLICLTLACLLYYMTSQATDIFKCINANGEVEYTQNSSDGCKASDVKSYAGKADQQAKDDFKNYQEESKLSAEAERLADQQKRDEERQKQEKKEYCDHLRSNLETLLTSPRIFHTDDQGNRVILDEQKRLKRIKEDQSKISEHCA